MSGIFVKPIVEEIMVLYEKMGSPELTSAVLNEIRNEVFPVESFRKLIEDTLKQRELGNIAHDKKLECYFNYCCGFGGKIGWHFKKDDKLITIIRNTDDAIKFAKEYKDE